MADKQLKDFTPYDSSIADTDVIVKQSSIGTTKGFLFSTLKSVLKTYFDTLYSKYLGDADFFQYSISRTVVSNNLTVALKNYEGNDPTPTKPVKIMIGGVLRTITSAVSRTRNAGTNWFNSGSAELATKEIDYFVYLTWVSASSSAELVFARIPGAILKGDFSASTTDERFGGGLAVSTDDTLNIGRFNATLSAGLAWSIPATSVIINSPIYETRWLEFIPVGTGYTAGGARYRISGTQVNVIIDSTTNITGNTTVPFTCSNTVDNQFTTSAGTAVLTKNTNLITVATNPQNISGFYGI